MNVRGYNFWVFINKKKKKKQRQNVRTDVRPKLGFPSLTTNVLKLMYSFSDINVTSNNRSNCEQPIRNNFVTDCRDKIINTRASVYVFCVPNPIFWLSHRKSCILSFNYHNWILLLEWQSDTRNFNRDKVL